MTDFQVFNEAETGDKPEADKHIKKPPQAGRRGSEVKTMDIRLLVELLESDSGIETIEGLTKEAGNVGLFFTVRVLREVLKLKALVCEIQGARGKTSNEDYDKAAVDMAKKIADSWKCLHQRERAFIIAMAKMDPRFQSLLLQALPGVLCDTPRAVNKKRSLGLCRYWPAKECRHVVDFLLHPQISIGGFRFGRHQKSHTNQSF